MVRPYWHNSCQIKHIENTFCAQTVQMHNGNMANSSFHELNAAVSACVTYSRLLVCHEDSIAGQMVAGASSVCVVCV